MDGETETSVSTSARGSDMLGLQPEKVFFSRYVGISWWFIKGKSVFFPEKDGLFLATSPKNRETHGKLPIQQRLVGG